MTIKDIDFIKVERLTEVDVNVQQPKDYTEVTAEEISRVLAQQHQGLKVSQEGDSIKIEPHDVQVPFTIEIAPAVIEPVKCGHCGKQMSAWSCDYDGQPMRSRVFCSQECAEAHDAKNRLEFDS